METIYLPKLKEVTHGFFLDENDMEEIYSRSVMIYDFETSEIIAIFLKRVLPQCDLDEKVIKVSKSLSNNRGNASGKMDIKYHSDDIDYFLDKPDLEKGKKVASDGTSTRSSAYPVKKDGKLIKRTRGNNVRSVSVGSFNATNIKGGTTPCRWTNWTQRNSSALKSIFPILESAEEWFKRLAPTQYHNQRSFADKIPQWVINGSIFSTITLNYDFRTATHTDKGDLKSGLTCFSVKEYGEWEGSYLCFPEYSFGVDVREGDLLIFNPHLVHCNTNMKGEGRLSMVLYCREKLIHCPQDNKEAGQKVAQAEEAL